MLVVAAGVSTWDSHRGFIVSPGHVCARVGVDCGRAVRVPPSPVIPWGMLCYGAMDQVPG